MENIEKIKSKVYKLVMLVDELEEEIKMYEWLSTKHFNRPYAKRYLKEKRKEIPNLAYPDSEMVYMDYYKLKDELQDTKEHLGEFLHEQEEENKRLNNIIEKLEQENAVLKTQVVNKDKYSYGIRMGSDKE